MPDAPRIKICGLTDPVEAAECAALGVWAIGLVFEPSSSRFVTVDQARRVVGALPAGVHRIGVFVEPAPREVAEMVSACGLTGVQLHGDGVDVQATRAAAGDVTVIQAFAVADAAALDGARRSDADLVLLDAHVSGRHGGTGRRFDWELLAMAEFGRPFVVAGGLDPSNVGSAVARLRPWGVDVSSGVEQAPGRKDVTRARAFVAAVKEGAAVESGT